MVENAWRATQWATWFYSRLTQENDNRILFAHKRMSSTRAATFQGGGVSQDDKEIASWESDSTVALNHPRLNASEQA